MGLLIVAYRAGGIGRPREWIEWIERRFVYGMELRFLGGFLLAVVAALAYLGGSADGLVGGMYAVSLTVLGLAGLGLLVTQNQARHIILGTAESGDATIRYVSIGMVVLGLLWALAPWF